MMQMTSLPQENKYHFSDHYTVYEQPAHVSVSHNEQRVSEDH